MRLLTSQKDSIYGLIEGTILPPSQFEFKEIILPSGKNATRLYFKNSEFYFSFETNPGGTHYSTCCPGAEKYIESQNPGAWDGQLRYFQNWLKYLIREINAPDKWQRLQKEIESININFTNGEDKFTVIEFEDLKTKIATLKEGIKKLDLLPEQMTIINSKLDYLTDMAKDMNKFDWKSLFIGTILQTIIQLSVTSENAKALWSLIKFTFNNFILP